MIVFLSSRTQKAKPVEEVGSACILSYRQTEVGQRYSMAERLERPASLPSFFNLT